MATGMKPWRFAPLDPVAANSSDKKPLEGIVFDVDGTLCEPQGYMFKEMREALDITKSVDILDHLYSLPPHEQEIARGKIEDIERRAMTVQTPQPGLRELMDYLDSRHIRKGICTRNFDIPIFHLLDTFIPDILFQPIVTRAFRPPKPDPAGILHIAKAWEVPDGERATGMIMVGDSIDDMTAGARAGALTVLLVNPTNEHLSDHEHTNVTIRRLDELISVLEHGTMR